MRSKTLPRVAFLLSVCTAAPALAGDGVLEINHVCATSTGCFPGDAPGYPVQVTAAGSYRLTSNLTVPAGTNGIEVANGVDLDLAGFEIAGPVSCLAACPAPTSGSGIAAAAFGGNQCAVSNGKVRGFGLDGIALNLQADVSRVRVTDIARHGLNLGGGSLAVGNLINRIGQNGIRFAVPSLVAPSLYERNTIANTGQQSVVEGKASAPNVCPDQLCGTSGKKLFYLTQTVESGANADTACAPGFHFASLWELFDVGSLEYDTSRGYTTADSGQGPPTAYAWARTGRDSFVGDYPGAANCDDWSSNSSSAFGSVVGLTRIWNTIDDLGLDFTAPVNPWFGAIFPCNSVNPRRSWCVQD